jgi:Ser/Thr protein kinase RdoA (MazF antagonist)
MFEPSIIPTSSQDVTSAWLMDVLSRSAPGTTIDHVEQEKIVHGAATKLRIRIDYLNNPASLPDRMWVKTGWEDHSPLMERAGVYAREATFYRDLAAAVGDRAPAGYFSAQDGEGRSVVVIEDLGERGADLWECTVPRRADDVAKLLSTLASLHARWWESDDLLHMTAVDWPVDADGPTAEWPRANGGERLREVLAGPRGQLMPQSTRDADRIDQAFWKMVETLKRVEGRCLLHGDAHPGNCFTDARGAGLYDWQTIARGPWAYDVSYLIVTAMAVEDRRYHERDLLAHYLDELAFAGVSNSPTFSAAWQDYLRYIAYPLLIWPTNHVSHQSEDNIRALSERLGAAAADFDFFALWGV